MPNILEIYKKTILLLCLTITVFESCTNNNGRPKAINEKFEISNFSATANYQVNNEKNKTIALDYKNAIKGFVIPSTNQIKDGFFKLKFDVKNVSKTKQKFFYKIFYENISYKFDEYDTLLKSEQTLAQENFYGSWENTNFTFRELVNELESGGNITIQDSFRIVGNPRNEERYFAEGVNDRWKRNPRVGNYEMMIVVCTENDLKQIPLEVQNISLKKNEKFSNPFYYFKYGNGKKLKETLVLKDQQQLKVYAKPDLGAGIYINDRNFENQNIDKSFFCKSCGQDDNLYQNAALQQFINYVDPSTKFNNIPVVMDILKDNYSQTEYNWNKCFYTKEELIPTYIQTTKKPCQTVFSDPINHKVIIKNPASKPGEWKKESVGIITRHGMTYGKYLAKVKLTELLNKDGVWNGLTNAIWLITQGGGEWNFRRNCNSANGYMSSYMGGANDKRVAAVDYTEIDFEIIKAPPYCPTNKFPPVFDNAVANNKRITDWNIKQPDDLKESRNKVSVACTNWDMACMEPKKFATGCNTIDYKGKTFHTFRWDSTYRALNEKYEELDDELFAKPYYYFEIDWRPTEIIWSIGPSKDNMRVVGYMNNLVTSIPNNQMLLIITQEYHNTMWWPGAPFAQDNLPFPLNDIPGEIYELLIE
jgi:hypothetical protein